MPNRFDNANIKYKDSVFRDYFNDSARLLNLCNSLLDTDYKETDLEINTLDSTFFSGLKNDISCKIGNNFLVLIEHQSSVNENMPFRCLSYVSELLNNIVPKNDVLYHRGLIHFPAPKFFVFYDGDDSSEPVNRIMKLSDAFGGDFSSLELIVHSVNINLGLQAEILRKCNFLNQYSTLIFYVKLGLKQKMSRRNAIINAINRCIQENIMKNYLIQKQEEVFSMLDLQWNFEDAKKAWRAEGFQEGVSAGLSQQAENIALNMLREGLPCEQIQKFTTLSIEKIKELAKNKFDSEKTTS